MTESQLVQNTSTPRTRSSLAEDLRQLGLLEGDRVIVHTSLSSLGWVCGGAVTVIQALMDVITSHGTLIMPTQSPTLSDPVHWEAPPVPEEWHPIIRAEMPAYDPATTPTQGMGQVAEIFRSWPGTLRSSHPKVSFAAWGKGAEEVVALHSLDNSMGEESPLAYLYKGNAAVLLLGADYDTNTSFHLAEYRVNYAPRIEEGAPVIEGGKRVWKTYTDLDHQTHLFSELGKSFESECRVYSGKVGSAKTRLFSQRDAVDYASRWLKSYSGSCFSKE
ncbi:aminoglycoside 3-N-acetyltransferase [Marininema mesophilum]|uniref:Aminoglycoside N(3)-acetyltransferase n=1 Tax=Marininema mesophilum TaxID=1048340 RepID=A0A1H2R6M2_9BACL|nr:AAC(3) family N-acetyltransferase [Marininema mesophilum]SDW15116.1 aminoglycoside 3-N-acetyltransferase [Marininema mesophilum]